MIARVEQPKSCKQDRSQKPPRVEVIPDNIPADLKTLERWLVWRWKWGGKKWDKPPLQTSGQNAKSNDETTWTTFDEAYAAYQSGRFDGIGIVLPEGIAGVDLDDCFRNGELTEDARLIVSMCGTYTERSPSGEGVKALVYGHLSSNHRKTDRERGIELFDGTKQYFTITGNRFDGTPAAIRPGQKQLTNIQKMITPVRDQRVSVGQCDTADRKLALEVVKHLKEERADNYHDWLGVLMALHSVGPDDEMLAAAIEFSSQSGKYQDGEVERKWESFHGGGCSLITLGSLVHWAKEDGWKPIADPKGRKVVSLMDAPSEAEKFVAESAVDGITTWRCYRDEMYRWDGTRYVVMRDRKFSKLITRRLGEIYYKSTQTHVKNLVAAIKARTDVDSEDNPPFWLDDMAEVRGNFIAVENGILDITKAVRGDTDCLRPHDPRFFSPVALPYPYDHKSDCPIWKRCIGRSLDGDFERIAMIQEWFGYCLLPGLAYHAYLMLMGEGGTGKSTLMAVLKAVVGADNVSTIALENFGDRFSLAETIGKLVNIVPEVGELDRMAEGRIKAFTSGDPMTFERKFKDPVTSLPTAKLVLATNTPPYFSDKTDGLWRRTLACPFYSKVAEADKIRGMDTPKWWLDKGEAPGILNWSIAGLKRLQDQNGFTRSVVAEAAKSEYRMECNSAATFLRDHFEVAPDGKEPCQETYSDYHHWCDDNGFKPFNATNFGREIRRHFPNLERKKKGPRGGQRWHYVGIKRIETNGVAGLLTNGQPGVPE